MLAQYKRPQIFIIEIVIEESISTASQRTITGGNNDDYTPSQEDWNNDAPYTNGFEF